MNGLLNVLEAARQHNIERIFWPSSIAAFGPTTPPDNTPQSTIMEPKTVYGISKLAGAAGTSSTTVSTCAACAIRG